MRSELEVHRHFIYMLAESHLDRRLRNKLDACDIVQETFVRASRRFEQLHEPDNEIVVRSWLQTILANVLADQRRHFTAGKRDIALERAIAFDLDRSASSLYDWLAADQTSPSMAAARNEELARLAEALQQLPEDVREVIVLRHIQNLTVNEIAARTDRTNASVAALLRRGLAKLRESMR